MSRAWENFGLRTFYLLISNYNPILGSAMDGPTSCKVVLAGSVAKHLLAEVADGLAKLRKPPTLVGFLANADPAARLYADWTDRTCKEK
jgi:hypothetical protein